MLRPILLAEDNEHDAVLFQHQITSARILNPLKIVTDGEDAIAYLGGQGKYADRSHYPLPLVLFLDLRMPKLGGYQVLAFLQGSALHRTLPVIVLSVLGDLKDVAEAYQRGAKSFLIKPLSAHDLLESLRAIPKLALVTEKEGISLVSSEWSELSVVPPPPARSLPETN